MNLIEQQLQFAARIHQAGDLRQAEALYRQLLTTHPRHAAAWEQLGHAKADQEAFDEALECYQRVLSIDPHHASALNNLGNVLGRLGRSQESLECYDRALAIQPGFVVVHMNKAMTLVVLGQLEAALRHFEAALRYDPENADIHKSVGIARLMLGDFAGGWPEYEWRYRAGEPALPAIDRPLWNGESLAGKTILLICEPGLGDDVQFIRYAPWLKERYQCRVLLAGRPKLRELLSACKGIDQWVEDAPPDLLPHFDVFAPLMRVPAVLAHTPQDAPADVPYLAADAALTEQWKLRLAKFTGRKIGIHCRAGHQQRLAALRNIPIAAVAKLAALPDVQLFSLQKGPEAEEVSRWSNIIDLGRNIDEHTGAFVETAAVLKNLDLLITCDTAIAHVAGALDVPVWLALCKPCDWRWSQAGDTTVWYPSMRLFRQNVPGDWAGVMERMAIALSGNESG